MKNSLVVTSLVLLLSAGFGCSQENDRYILNYTDTVTNCIRIMMQFEVNVTYLQVNGSTSSAIVPGVNFTMDEIMPDCTGDDSGSIMIPWLNGDFMLTLNFDATSEKFWNISSMDFEYYGANSSSYFIDPKRNGNDMNATVDNFQNVDWNTSYSCSSNVSYNLMSGDAQTADIVISYIEVQVFSFSKPLQFSSGKQCQSSQGSNDDDDDKIVPIAVGCALAGLVIIVLIAYLIGRFRNRKTDTYQVLS